MVYALGLGPSVARRGGSSPLLPTKTELNGFFKVYDTKRLARATRFCTKHRASAKQKCGEHMCTPLRLADSAVTPKEKTLLAFLKSKGSGTFD